MPVVGNRLATGRIAPYVLDVAVISPTDEAVVATVALTVTAPAGTFNHAGGFGSPSSTVMVHDVLSPAFTVAWSRLQAPAGMVPSASTV